MNGSWKVAAADAIDAQAAVLADALAALEEAEAVLERLGRDRACTELRGVAASLRSERADLQAQASSLRPPRDGMALSLTSGPTTRRPLRRIPHPVLEEEP